MRWLVIISFCVTGCGVLPERWTETAAEPDINDPALDVISDDTQNPEPEFQDQAGVRATGPLGRTVASLGDASQPGLWLKTPMVAAQGPGSVTYPATGRSIAVTLIPIDGPATAGSRLSLQAMQALGASLTDLPEIDVSAGR